MSNCSGFHEIAGMNNPNKTCIFLSVYVRFKSISIYSNMQGHKQGSLRYDKEGTLWSRRGGGVAESSSLYLAYMDVTLKKKRKSRCFIFLSYRRIKMFEKTNGNKLG